MNLIWMLNMIMAADRLVVGDRVYICFGSVFTMTNGIPQGAGFNTFSCSMEAGQKVIKIQPGGGLHAPHHQHEIVLRYKIELASESQHRSTFISFPPGSGQIQVPPLWEFIIGHTLYNTLTHENICLTSGSTYRLFNTGLLAGDILGSDEATFIAKVPASTVMDCERGRPTDIVRNRTIRCSLSGLWPALNQPIIKENPMGPVDMIFTVTKIYDMPAQEAGQAGGSDWGAGGYGGASGYDGEYGGDPSQGGEIESD